MHNFIKLQMLSKLCCSYYWSRGMAGLRALFRARRYQNSRSSDIHSRFVVIQSLSRVWFFATPWTTAHQASLSFTISRSLLKHMSIELVMPSNHLILRHPYFLLPPIFPSIRVLPNQSTLRIRWLKYWTFSFSINPSNEYSFVDLRLTGLISLLSSEFHEQSWFRGLYWEGRPVKKSSRADSYLQCASIHVKDIASVLYAHTLYIIFNFLSTTVKKTSDWVSRSKRAKHCLWCIFTVFNSFFKLWTPSLHLVDLGD